MGLSSTDVLNQWRVRHSPPANDTDEVIHAVIHELSTLRADREADVPTCNRCGARLVHGGSLGWFCPKPECKEPSRQAGPSPAEVAGLITRNGDVLSIDFADIDSHLEAWEKELAALRAERDALAAKVDELLAADLAGINGLQAEVNRLRPIIDAAERWRDSFEIEDEEALEIAIDNCRDARDQGEGKP